jgi:Rrf2 family protein
MTFLARYTDQWITSSHLANSININPALVRKELAELSNHKLLESKEGKYGGVRLARPAFQIQLSEIFQVVKGSDHILEYCKNEGNRNCPIGRQIETQLDLLYSDMDDLLARSLEKISLEEFKNRF